jgi:hypothetical protein
MRPSHPKPEPRVFSPAVVRELPKPPADPREIEAW